MFLLSAPPLPLRFQSPNQTEGIRGRKSCGPAWEGLIICPAHPEHGRAHTRSIRETFCFRRRRLCLLIRREALLCSVELLNLWGPKSFPTRLAHPGPNTMPTSLPEVKEASAGFRPPHGSLALLTPIPVPMKGKPHLLVESSSSESKKLVVSSSLLIRVDELS